jgi:polar amino acid transport system substrate-binding protein
LRFHPICQLAALRYPDPALASLAKPLSWEPLGIAIPANDLLLINWLQNLLNTLEKSGELQMIGERWFKDASWIKQLK